MKLFKWVMLASVLLTAAGATAATVRYGIFAGHNLGSQSEALKYAEKDAGKLASIFRDLGGMAPENMRVLKSPDLATLQAAFADLEEKARAAHNENDAVFFFYFSGHGDETALVLGEQRLPLTELKAMFDRFPSKLKIGMFDACRSGAITRLKGAKVIEPFVLQRGVNGEGSIYITSSSEKENSQEADDLQGSFFSHHLMSGLRGAADASGDKHVTLMEAYNYAFNHTVAETGGTRGGTQHPNARFRMDLEGDIVLTDLSTGTGGLQFPKGTQGEYIILDEHAALMAEVNKDARNEIFIALEPGRYSIFKKSGPTVQGKALAILKAGEVQRFSEETLEKYALGEVKAKGLGSGPAVFPAEMLSHRNQRVGVELGYTYNRGPDYYGAISWSLPGPFILSGQAGYRSRISYQGGDYYRFRLNLEFFNIRLASLQIFSRTAFELGRVRDRQISYYEKLQYTCPDWDSSPEGKTTCTVDLYRYKTDYSTRTGTALDAGLRLLLGPGVDISVRSGLNYNFQDRSYDEYFVTGGGFQSQPITVAIESLF